MKARLGVSAIVWAIIGIVIAVAIGVALYLSLSGAWAGTTQLIVEAKRPSATLLEIIVRVPSGGSVVINKVEFVTHEGSKTPSDAGVTLKMLSLNGEDITEKYADNQDLKGLALKGGDVLIVDYDFTNAEVTAADVSGVMIYTNVGTFSAKVTG